MFAVRRQCIILVMCCAPATKPQSTSRVLVSRDYFVFVEDSTPMIVPEKRSTPGSTPFVMCLLYWRAGRG